MSVRGFRCLRCGQDVFTAGACCRPCRLVDPDVCQALTRSWKVDRWRREAKRLRILHRGRTPWAASGPRDDRRAPQPVQVRNIEPRPTPTRRTA